MLGCSLGTSAAAEGNSSLSDSNLETVEAKAAAELSLEKGVELRKQLALQQETVKALTDSLAASNAEAELFRRKYADLQLRMEALGLDSLNKDRAKIEQRLLKAVSDLQLLQKERDEYREQMLRLTETVLRVLKSSEGIEPQARMDIEEQLRVANQLLGGAAEIANEPTLMDGRVVSFKEEWLLVVGNLGAKQGVKIGMPLRVVRDGKTIATLRVVDVREKISGAVIQEKSSDSAKIRVGDRLQVDARQNVSLK